MARAKSPITSQAYEYNGQYYSFGEICTMFGVKYNSVYSRMRDKGMTITEAIDDCLSKTECWGKSYGQDKVNVTRRNKKDGDLHAD